MTNVFVGIYKYMIYKLTFVSVLFSTVCKQAPPPPPEYSCQWYVLGVLGAVLPKFVLDSIIIILYVIEL